MKMSNIRTLLYLSILLFATSCGYRPIGIATTPILEGSISTYVKISMRDPDNTVLLKDALDRAVVQSFKSSLTDKDSAKTHLIISLENSEFIPIRYDKNGYIVSYRAIISLHILRTTSNKTKSYHTEGSYHFNIEPSAIISDRSRFEAIDQGAQKALDSFVAQVVSEGASL